MGRLYGILFYFFFLFTACNTQNTEVPKKKLAIQIAALEKKSYLYAEKVLLSLDSKVWIDSLHWIDETKQIIETAYFYIQENPQPLIFLPTQKLGRRQLQLILFSKGLSKKFDFKFEVFSDLIPQKWDYTIVAKYPHLSKNYTQGLEFLGDTLYESTGLYGQSKLLTYILPKTDKPLQTIKLEDHFFGEGIGIWQDKIYQLTWKNQQGFIYNAKNIEIENTFSYLGEGWGLAHNQKQDFILSNGSEKLQFLKDENLQKEGEISVYSHQEKIDLLNELEYVEGKIWANRYYSDTVYVIEEKTGRVIAYLDFSALRDKLSNAENAEVLNGIAYHKKSKSFFITGKLWPHFFQVRVKACCD